MYLCLKGELLYKKKSVIGGLCTCVKSGELLYKRSVIGGLCTCLKWGTAVQKVVCDWSFVYLC